MNKLTMIPKSSGEKTTNSILLPFKGLIALLAVLITLGGPNVMAASEITMSPASARIELKAGQQFEGSFTIFNSGDVDYNFDVYAGPYQIKKNSEAYEQDFVTQSDRTQLSRWISFDQSRYFTKAGTNVKVKYQVNVPSSIPDGGQYAVIFAESESAAGGSVMSKNRVGILLYASTNGKTIDKAEILETKLPGVVLNSELLVAQRVSNKGNTDFDAESILSVNTLLGKKLCENKKVAAILPETTRSIALDCEISGSGIFQVKINSRAFDQKSEVTKIVLFITPPVLIGIVVAVAALIGWRINGSKGKNYRRR